MAAGLSQRFSSDESVMQRALELARRGLGAVEPNPAVGAVVVNEQYEVLGEGWHRRFGGPHAEVEALRDAGESARGAILFVTLEPCSHYGKTPPCTEAVIQAGIRRVVIGSPDPAPHTAGKGIETLQSSDIDVQIGLLADEADELIAPFTKLQKTGRPYVHAKWAMTLDGKIASRTGASQWISNELSRQRVHQLRGRMDAIIVGAGTVLADDPMLTARPPGPRTPTRIVLDRRGQLPVDAQLVQTAREVPVMAVVGPQAEAASRSHLEKLGVEVLVLDTCDRTAFIAALLDELGNRQLTNVLIEGGSAVLGDFWDGQLIDEVHCFVAPKLVGGKQGLSPFGGAGLAEIPQRMSLVHPHIEILQGDVYIHGRLRTHEEHSPTAPPASLQ